MSSLSATLMIAFKALEKLNEVNKAANSADTKLAIADLKSALADIKMNYSEIIEENTKMKSEIGNLKKLCSVREFLSLVEGAYYLLKEVEGHKEGFYCSSCFESKAILVPLSRAQGGMQVFVCGLCNAKYTGLHKNFLNK